MVKIALSCPVYHYFSLEELFSFAKKVGFDGVEYLAGVKDLYKKPYHVLNLSNEYRIPVLSVHQPIYTVFYVPSFIVPAMVSLAKFFPSATITNQHLSAFLNPLGNNTAAAEKFIILAKKMGIQVSYESNPERFYLSTRYPRETYDVASFEKFSEKYNLPITLDTSHIPHVGGNIITFFEKNHSRIKLIHLSDYKNGQEHLPLGIGNLPLKEFFQTIKNTKWDGQITFEIGNIKHLKSKKKKLRAIEKSLILVRKYF